MYDFADDAAENPTFYADLTNPQSLKKYQYTYNNPVNMTDEDGHCPICAAVLEVAGTVVDVVTTVRTLRDPNASTAERVVTVGGTVAGLALPGGGYAAVGKAITKQLVKREAKREATEAVAKSVDNVADALKATPAKEPYKRPSGATTKEQRESVQGKPCVDCGKSAPKMNADHKTPLVKEHYKTGTVNRTRMRQPSAVQPQCPTCSNRQGANLSRYSREMKKKLPK